MREKSGLTARRRRIVVACSVAAAGLLLALVYWLWQRPSAEEQLQAIDAVHAIPDEENAAPDYMDIVLGNTGPSLDPKPLSQTVQTGTLAIMWRSTDFPEAAKWLEERQAIMDALLQASRKPRCWFSVCETSRQRTRRYDVASSGALLLLRSAGNDLGEQRWEAGLEKLLAVLRMGEHFRSQVNPSDRYVGMSITAEGLKRVKEIIFVRNISPDWLTRLAAVLPPVEDTWKQDYRSAKKITTLHMETMRRGFMVRLRYALAGEGRARTLHMRREYLAQLTQFRIARTLLELRRYRDETGRCPASLDEIRNRVPLETFLNPRTGAPFEYRPTETGFGLGASVREE